MKQTLVHRRLMMVLVILTIIWLSLPYWAEAQNVIPTTTPGALFTGNSRGYWFTAPCDFRLTGVRAPTDYSTNAQSIHLVKFPAVPATFPSTTTVFTTLYYGSNLTDTCFVDLDIQVQTGDIIGVMAVRNDGSGTSVTSYSNSNAPINSAIGLYTITLQRLGWQGNIVSIPAANFWTEAGNPIGRAEIRYELSPALIPIPAHSSFFTGSYSRGFWFTAPCDILLTGVRAPKDFNTNPQSIHLVKFPAAPATYPSTTTTFTTLFYGFNINDTGFIDVNIQIYTGDVIGVLAVRDNGSGSAQTSYTASNGPIPSTIGNHTISLQRLGWQDNIISSPATNFWTEPGVQIGRADLRYEVPSVYKYSPGGLISNSFPFYEPHTGNNKRQWIYHPSDFSCTPVGYIKTIYLKSSSAFTSNFSGLLIRMGLTSLATFPGSTFITALDTVLYAPTFSLSSISENWIPIRLQRPFYYDGSSNFVVEASQQGYTTGFYTMQTTLTGRSIYGNSASSTGTQQDRLASLGLEIVTDYTDAMLESFTSPGASLCEGSYPISVVLKNLSPDTLTQADIHLQINVTFQPVHHWTGTLLPGNNITVPLGSFPFAALSSPYHMKAWVSQPNNTVDLNPYNDTIVIPSIIVLPSPLVNLGPDITLKVNGSIQLNAGTGFSSYLWSTGANTQTIIVDTTGIGIGAITIWIKVTDANGCEGSDTILVTFIDDSGVADLKKATTILIRPNPNDGKFELILNGFPVGDYHVQIFGREGYLVRELILPINDSKPIVSFNLPHLPDGLYLLKLTGSQGTVTKKLVISR